MVAYKKWLWLALLWFVVLCYALFFKPVGHFPKITNADKMAHFGLFFGQFWFVGRSLLAYSNKGYWRIGLLLALLLAVGSELLQGMTKYRAMEFFDGVTDMVGAVLALTLVRWANKMGYLKIY